VEPGLLARTGPAAHLDAREALDSLDVEIAGAGIEAQCLEAVRVDVQRALRVEAAVLGARGQRGAGHRDRGGEQGGRKCMAGHGTSWDTGPGAHHPWDARPRRRV